MRKMALSQLVLTVCACLLTFCYLTIVAADDEYVNIDTVYGTVRGRVDKSLGIPVNTFLGIPYAKAPTGPLRFKAPLDPDKWDGVRDALNFGDKCMQRDWPEFTFKNWDVPPSRSEDCLYLNVYTTSRGDNPKESLPVMVWIHGGAFLVGSGSQYDGTSLAAKDVIIVTINYRVDVFGFLSTEDENMPGNYGMLDQIAVLQWVKKNIAAFGGDPQRVTIFGESAGSMSVSLLILSPLAKGLFQRAIMESNGAMSPMATARPGNREQSRTIARLISASAECKDLDNSTLLLNCLQQVDAVKLLEISNSVETALEAGMMIMIPRVESTFGFLPDLPVNLLSTGAFNHVDTIRGYNTDEMGLLFGYLPTNMTTTEFKSTLISLLKRNFGLFNHLDKVKVLEMMKSTFLTSSSSNDVMRKEATDALDDFIFVGPLIAETNMYVARATKKKNYVYEFHHKPSFKLDSMPESLHASHGDELAYVFNVSTKAFVENGVISGPPEDVDIQVSKQMMEMWTNFAKSGDPTSTVPVGGVLWKPYTLSHPSHIIIKETSESKDLLRPQAFVNFFDSIIEILDNVKIQAGTTTEGTRLLHDDL